MELHYLRPRWRGRRAQNGHVATRQAASPHGGVQFMAVPRGHAAHMCMLAFLVATPRGAAAHFGRGGGGIFAVAAPAGRRSVACGLHACLDGPGPAAWRGCAPAAALAQARRSGASQNALGAAARGRCALGAPARPSASEVTGFVIYIYLLCIYNFLLSCVFSPENSGNFTNCRPGGYYPRAKRRRTNSVARAIFGPKRPFGVTPSVGGLPPHIWAAKPRPLGRCAR